MDQRTGSGFPLSFAQRRLWFMYRLRPGSPAYNVTHAFRVRGHFDQAVFAGAIEDLVSRHAMLRTRFFELDGVPYQQIAEVHGPHTRVERYFGLETDRDSVMEQISHRLAQRPITLENGEVFDATVVCFDDEDHGIVLRINHIITDEWSTDILLQELSKLYSARRDGTRPRLPVLTASYFTYAEQQARSEYEPPAAELLRARAEELGGAPSSLRLPYDYPEPDKSTLSGSEYVFVLSSQQLKAARRVARSSAATLASTLLAVWTVLLSRYCAQDDLIVGVTSAFRPERQLETLVGCFINILPIRADMRDDPQFADHLARISGRLLDSYEAGEVAFDRLVAELNPARRSTRPSLTQAHFQFQSASSGVAPVIHGQSWSPVRVHNGQAKYELLLNVSEMADGLHCMIEYRDELFSPSTIQELTRHFSVLLDDVCVSPTTPISSLRLLEENERRRILNLSDGPQFESGVPDVLTHIEKQIHCRPLESAVIAGTNTYSYSDLERSVQRKCAALSSCGVRRGDLVGVALPRGYDLIVTLIAILKLGAVFVPLDLSYPPARLALMVRKVAARVIVTDQAQARRLKSILSPAALVTDAQLCAAKRSAQPETPLAPEYSSAYVMFTSGSSGEPKGVVIRRRSVNHLVSWALNEFSASDLSFVLASTSISFDLSIFEIFTPLAAGGTVVLAENLLALPELPARERVTLINAVPSVLSEVIEWELPGSVQVITLCGEALGRSLVRRIHAAAPRARIYNLYGPTETTGFSTFSRVSPDDHGAPTIGRPLPGESVYVLDQHLEPVPLGVPGGVYIAGAGLAAGYFRDNEQTSKRFIPSCTDPTARMYMTGDIAYMNRNCELVYVGRSDRQVKVRGIRTELDEVEAAIADLPGVRGVSVGLSGLSAQNSELTAYVVGDWGHGGLAALRGRLASRLPSAMIPTRWIPVDRLTRLPNGKIDRSGSDREFGQPSHPLDDAPRGRFEECTARVWAEVLGISPVGRHANFFELGGHSLSAVRVASRMSAALDITLPVVTVIDNPTVRSLGEVCSELAINQSRNVPRPMFPGSGVPLTFQQQSFLELEELLPSEGYFHIPITLRLQGELDESRLVRALRTVYRRHPALLVRVKDQNNALVQEPALGHEDAAVLECNCPPQDMDSLHKSMRAFAVKPFDFQKGPLFRQGLFRTISGDAVLCFIFHHFLLDEWSAGLIVSELLRAYDEDDSTHHQQDATYSYAQYAVEQWAVFTGNADEAMPGRVEDFRGHFRYWREALMNLPPVLRIGNDHNPHSPTALLSTADVRLELEVDLVKRTLDTARRCGTSPFVVLLGAIELLLSRQTDGTQSFPLGCVVANRGRPEYASMIGCFINTVILRADLADARPADDLIRQVHLSTFSALQHQEFPFDVIKAIAEQEFDRHPSDLFNVLIVMQNSLESLPAHIDTLSIIEWDEAPLIGRTPTTAPLTLFIKQSRGERVRLQLRYVEKMFSQAQALFILEGISSSLESLV